MKTSMIIAALHTLQLTVGGCKIKPEKNSDLNGIRTLDHCDTGAVL